MLIILAYAFSIAGVIWYSLFYLPYGDFTQNLSFPLNIAQWGIVSLLSFLTYRQESNYRSIFLQFWLFFALLALGAPAVLHFQYVGSSNEGVVSYVYNMHILTHIMQAWIIANIVLTYIFRDEKRLVVNSFCAAVVLPLTLWLFWPYWWNPEAVIVQNAAGDWIADYRPLEITVIWVNAFSLAALLAFFLHKLRTDKPIGAYADTLLYLFGMMLVIETTEYIAAISDFQLLGMSQWMYSLIAASMIVTYLLRLKFKSQTIAEYYESQCLSDNPDIDRRIGYFDRLILRSFFDPEKVGKEVFLGTGRKKMSVRRTPTRISKPMRIQ